MAKYYCHETFKSGLTCAHRTSDGTCSGGIWCSCEHRSKTPPILAPKPAKRRSTDCSWCKHKNVCSLKNRFNKLKSENYPMICECQYYELHNPLLEV